MEVELPAELWDEILARGGPLGLASDAPFVAARRIQRAWRMCWGDQAYRIDAHALVWSHDFKGFKRGRLGMLSNGKWYVQIPSPVIWTIMLPQTTRGIRIKLLC